MEPVQEWVRRRAHFIEKMTGWRVKELDFADDRLAACLRELDKTKVWGGNRREIRDAANPSLRLEHRPDTLGCNGRNGVPPSRFESGFG